MDTRGDLVQNLSLTIANYIKTPRQDLKNVKFLTLKATEIYTKYNHILDSDIKFDELRVFCKEHYEDLVLVHPKLEKQLTLFLEEPQCRIMFLLWGGADPEFKQGYDFVCFIVLKDWI